MNEASRKISLDYVIKQSFKYWKSTLFYQLVFTIVYFSTLTIFLIFLYQYFEIGSKIIEVKPLLESSNAETSANGYIELLSSSNVRNLVYFFSVVASALVYPLNIGFFKIYSLIDEQKPISLNYLFEGYLGNNFFKFLSYYLIWGTVFYLLKMSIFPFAFLWVAFTIFVAPLLFFTPMNLIEAMKISFKVVAGNFFVIAACSILAIIFSYSGFFLFFFGLLFTFPFWNAIIYTLFKSYFRIKFV